MIFNKFSHSFMVFDICSLCALARSLAHSFTQGTIWEMKRKAAYTRSPLCTLFFLRCMLVMLFTWFTFYRWFSTISCIYYLDFDHSFITRLNFESSKVRWIYAYDTVDGNHNNRCEIVTHFCAPQFIIHILSDMTEPNESQLRAQRNSSFTFINNQIFFRSHRLALFIYFRFDWHMTSHDMI